MPMFARLGEVFYWLFSVIAALLAALGVRAAYNSYDAPWLFMLLVFLGAAAMFWLFGLGARYVLSRLPPTGR